MARNTVRASSRRSPHQRKTEILSAARQVLRETGYENFQLIDVAKRCKLSEGTIYRYFPTKKDLLVSLAEVWLEELLLGEERLVRGIDTYARLHSEIDYALRVVRKEPELSRYIFLSQRGDPDYKGTRLYRLVGEFTAQLISVVNEAVAAGIFRDDVPVDVVRNIVFGTVEHQAWAYLRNEGEFSVTAAADHITGFVFRGMAVAGPVNVEEVRRLRMEVKSVTEQLTNAVTILLNSVEQKGKGL